MDQSEMNSMMKHFQLTDKDLNQQISDCHIAEISDSFCEKWRLLPPYLELEDIVEKDVDREHQGSDESEKRCSFLKKWKKIIGLKATYKMLISALLRVKCRNEAEGVCKLLKKHTATGSHQAGQEQSDSSASPKASNAISISSLSPSDRGDLQFLLKSNLRNILTAFANYTFCIQLSLQEKNIDVSSICDYLMGFTSSDHSIALLTCAKRDELESANTISKIFRFLKKECTSFLNYDIFECLIERFKLDRDQEDLQYPEKLKAFVTKHTISEFIEIKPALSEYTVDKMKLTLVLNINSINQLDKLLDVANTVSKIMGILPSALLIYDIKESCVEVTFLIPRSLAEIIFISDEIFSEYQKERFCNLLVKQIECNGHKFEFSSVEDLTPTTPVLKGDYPHPNTRLLTYSILSRDEAEYSPLHTAAQHGQLEVFKNLLFTDEVPIFTLKLEPGCKLSDALKLISQRKLSGKYKDINGNTPLHTACVHGQLDVARLLTREIGCDPNSTNNEGLSCLHLATQHGHLPLVRYLMEEVGSDMNLEDEHGRTPTFLAAGEGHLDILKYLIEERGADPQFKTTKVSLATIATGQSLLHTATYNEHYPVIKYLFEQCNLNVSCEDDDGIAPLHVACIRGNIDIIKYFVITANCDPHQPGKKGITCLHIACKCGHLDVVKYLVIMHHCDPDVNADAFGRMPLHYAAREGHLQVFKYLVEDLKCDYDYPDSNGSGPLHYASHAGQLHVVKYLVDIHHSNPLVENHETLTPLHAASKKGHLEVVKYLTVTHHCDPEVKTIKHYTPLMCAAMNGYLNVVKFLIEDMKCDPNITDLYGLTPLHDASREGHLDVVKYLAEKCNCNPLCRDGDGGTPLHDAAANGQIDIVRYFFDTHNCDPQVKTDKKLTPLIYAVTNAHVDVVKLLIEDMKCDPNVADANGCTPLHLAIRGHMDIIKYLVEECHCDPLNGDIDGVTPLHDAAAVDRIDIVRYFVFNHHCDPRVKTAFHLTPLDYAAMYGFIITVRCLLDSYCCDIRLKNTDILRAKGLADENGHNNISIYFRSIGDGGLPHGFNLYQSDDDILNQLSGNTHVLSCANGVMNLITEIGESLNCSDPQTVLKKVREIEDLIATIDGLAKEVEHMDVSEVVAASRQLSLVAEIQLEEYAAAGCTDIWPELQDGLLSTIADLAGFVQEFITAYSGYQAPASTQPLLPVSEPTTPQLSQGLRIGRKHLERIMDYMDMRDKRMFISIGHSTNFPEAA